MVVARVIRNFRGCGALMLPILPNSSHFHIWKNWEYYSNCGGSTKNSPEGYGTKYKWVPWKQFDWKQLAQSSRLTEEISLGADPWHECLLKKKTEP